MQGLATPQDIIGAWTSASRINADTFAASRTTAGSASTRVPATFEEILMSQKIDLYGGDRAIMKAMDASRDAEENRRLGKSQSVFDSLGQVTVARAVSSFYAQNSRIRPDLAATEPFSPSLAIQKNMPHVGAIIKKTLSEDSRMTGAEKVLWQQLVDNTFPATTLDQLVAKEQGSPAAALTYMTQTISPKLARAVGLAGVHKPASV